MTFLWPNMLWLLFSVPVLVLAYLAILRRRKKSALRYAALSLVKTAMGAGPGFRRHVPPLLFLVAVTVMIVSMARPAGTVYLPSDHGTVILAMDISGSMRARDISPSRIEAAQAAARAFVAGQPHNVLIGVVAFAATATLVQPPTQNRDDVLAAIDRFQLQRGTAVGSGILASLSAIFENAKIDIGPIETTPAAPLDPTAKPDPPAPTPVEPGTFRSAVIVLLTDGQTNTGPDPLDAAKKAADLGVRVFTVGLGTARGQVLGFGGWSWRAQLDEESLKRIADITHGKYFKADSDTNLKGIYHELSTQLNMEKEKTEITALFTAAAAALVLASALLSVLWFNRII